MAKIWFVTGASRGLGRSIAEAALESGGSVVATARTPQTLAPLVEKYGADRVLPVALDVADNDQVLRAVQAGVDRFGRLDVVVNNAGYANTAALEDIDLADFRAQIDTNFLGVVYVTKAVLPIMRQQTPAGGHIFQISSMGGRIASPGLVAYQAAKWAVSGFSTGLAGEVAPFGIRVTALEPGSIQTDWGGSSMQVTPVSEPYQPTVGNFVKLLRELSGKELSAPSKIAQIILRLLDEKDPPVRLLVGADAVEYVGKAAEALAASDAKWRELSLSST